MATGKMFVRAALLAIVVSMVFSLTASAQNMKMGFVNDELIKSKYPAWQRAQEQWDNERKVWDDSAQARQTALQDMITEYDKVRLILTDEKRKERESAIRAKQDDLDAFTKQIFGPGGTAERKQEELIQPLLENVNKAIEAVALAENYDVIFTLQSGLGYIKETYDVTQKVLDALEKLEK
jgi:outer membrane protein